ncbi:MAG: SHOCT domain-containing protein [Acidimicrobiia bacterium]
MQDAAGGSAADEIKKLNDLKSSGVLSEAEFAAQKAKLLA